MFQACLTPIIIHFIQILILLIFNSIFNMLNFFIPFKKFGSNDANFILFKVKPTFYIGDCYIILCYCYLNQISKYSNF